jgi:hypothetical protein
MFSESNSTKHRLFGASNLRLGGKLAPRAKRSAGLARVQGE